MPRTTQGHVPPPWQPAATEPPLRTNRHQPSTHSNLFSTQLPFIRVLHFYFFLYTFLSRSASLLKHSCDTSNLHCNPHFIAGGKTPQPIIRQALETRRGLVRKMFNMWWKTYLLIVSLVVRPKTFFIIIGSQRSPCKHGLAGVKRLPFGKQ